MTSEPDLTRRPRTRRVFSEDDMTRMAALYYDPDVPMPRVGAAFGVPASTFLRWIAEMDWPRRSARGRAGADRQGAEGAAHAPAWAHGAAPPRPRKVRMPARIGIICGEEAPESLAAFQTACHVARRELEAIWACPPQTLHERERVARVLASMSTSLLRFQRGTEAEAMRFAKMIASKRRG